MIAPSTHSVSIPFSNKKQIDNDRIFVCHKSAADENHIFSSKMGHYQDVINYVQKNEVLIDECCCRNMRKDHNSIVVVWF